jgi:hypothetical protein
LPFSLLALRCVCARGCARAWHTCVRVRACQLAQLNVAVDYIEMGTGGA